MAQTDVFLNAIRQSGRRVTEQRRAICGCLARNRSHPTPSQVYADVSKKHPEISKATVYNTLNILQGIGAIVGINFGDSHTHYETNTTPHVNLICLRCHNIVDAPIVPLVDGSNEAWVGNGFQPVAVKMDVYGFCESCRHRKRLEIQDQLRQTREFANATQSKQLRGNGQL
jgi:Fur family peroxide stress response transcriptional regulator